MSLRENVEKRIKVFREWAETISDKASPRAHNYAEGRKHAYEEVIKWLDEESQSETSRKMKMDEDLLPYGPPTGPYSAKPCIDCTSLPDGQLCKQHQPAEHDPVNPAHYNGAACQEAIAIVTADLKGEEAFNTGQVIKYMWRWKKKNGVEDLKKAKWYLDRLIEAGEQG